MNEQKFNTGALQLNYIETTSQGIPLLLLHGGSSRWQTFSSIIPDLDAFSHIYALDLRGHGKSDRAERYLIQDYVSDIVSFISEQIKEPTVIFGHSLGGIVGIMLAANHPALARALIIGDSPFHADVLKSGDNSHAARWKEMIEQGKSAEEITEELKNREIFDPKKNKTIKAREFYGEDDPYFEFMGISLSQNDPAMLESVTDKVDETFADYSIETLFPKITCPVLILQGDSKFGGMIKDEDIKIAETLLLNVTVYPCKNIGHGLYLDDKEQVVTQMIAFLKNFSS